MGNSGEKKKMRPGADWWLFVLGFVIFAGITWLVTPAILYAEKDQPVQFSHKVHGPNGSAALDCNYCHKFREDGSYSGIPGLNNCKECHEDMQGDTKAEYKLVNDFVKKNKPVPWLVYSQQPDCVFFSHAAHVKNAGLECTKCHGKHGESDKLKPYQYNRLSTYSRDIWGQNLIGWGDPPNRMKMDDCADCHRQNGVRDACFVCHK